VTDESTEEPAGFEPQINILPQDRAGVWANYARVSHSPYEFTLDFVRLDFTERPPSGVVVARVSVSPLMVTQLIEALNDNWQKYAEKAMPREIT
jgi:hypothetical protein